VSRGIRLTLPNTTGFDARVKEHNIYCSYDNVNIRKSVLKLCS